MEARNDTTLDPELPPWMQDVPLVHGWCRYNGQIYYAVLNFDKSREREQAVFDLAYCATKALNESFLITRDWDAKKFRRWKNHSNW